MIGGLRAESQAESRYYEAIQKTQFFELTDESTHEMYAGDPANARTEIMLFVRP